MPFISPLTREVLQRPGAFALQVIKAFRANQGLLLAGAVAYYTLLSIVPLLILMVIGLSHVIDEAELLEALRRALEWIVPGQSKALLQELASFLNHRQVIGWVLLATMIFFSSLAFTVLQNAMSVIFLHRVVKRQRHFLVALLLPVGYIAFFSAALFIGTWVLANLIAVGEESLYFAGRSWSLDRVSRALLYLGGIAGEILVISSIYLFMPVGRLPWRHALFGGITATLLWEIIRHALVWYFGTLSQVNLVYGSLTTAIVVLLSLEIAATLILLGAQVIAEYERFSLQAPDKIPVPMRTEPVEQANHKG